MWEGRNRDDDLIRARIRRTAGRMRRKGRKKNEKKRGRIYGRKKNEFGGR